MTQAELQSMRAQVAEAEAALGPHMEVGIDAMHALLRFTLLLCLILRLVLTSYLSSSSYNSSSSSLICSSPSYISSSSAPSF
jgi:hypothetical protein